MNDKRWLPSWLIAVVALCATSVGALDGASDERVFELLREGGNVVLVRHATTVPGIGDPPGFDLADCATQRNLSDAGRAASRRLGNRLRDADVPIAAVRSSAWCRCLETATLAFAPDLPVEVWAPLNSFFAGQGDRESQTRAALAALRDLPPQANWVWVTHQVNITALTGTSVAMGEVLVTRPADGRLQVLARWRP
ncbi:histidine phosphatase family protein [Rhodocyclaceae bacterium SMB388]